MRGGFVEVLYVVLIIVAALIAIVLLTSFVCFWMAFYAPRKKIDEEYPIPPGKIYEPHHETMVSWIKEARAMPHDDVSIQSFDGLTLCGQYFGTDFSEF